MGAQGVSTLSMAETTRSLRGETLLKESHRAARHFFRRSRIGGCCQWFLSPIGLPNGALSMWWVPSPKSQLGPKAWPGKLLPSPPNSHKADSQGVALGKNLPPRSRKCLQNRKSRAAGAILFSWSYMQGRKHEIIIMRRGGVSEIG